MGAREARRLNNVGVCRESEKGVVDRAGCSCHHSEPTAVAGDVLCASRGSGEGDRGDVERTPPSAASFSSSVVDAVERLAPTAAGFMPTTVP